MSKKATPEDIENAKKLLKRILGLGGMAFLAAGGYFCFTGEIPISHGSSSIRKIVKVDEDPTEFWVLVSMCFAIGGAMMFAAFRPEKR